MTSETPTSDPGIDPLDRARREWLAGLVRTHVATPTAQSALALAQGEWLAGEYADAVSHFTEARDRAPSAPATHLALLRGVSMLGRREQEGEVLARALQAHPDDPQIALHAALDEVPDALDRAQARLARFPGEPIHAAFAQAITIVAGGSTADADIPNAGAPDLRARWESLRWACRHAAGPGVHVGLPVRVLQRALTEAALPGLVMECGVYFGRSLDIIAHRLDQPVHGFDSFQGLPEAWKPGEDAGAYSTAGRRPRVAGNVTLHAGWFEQTLPPFLAANPGPVRLLHIDCDIYSSTRTVLQAVADRLQPGSIIVFDDMLGYPGHEGHELRAFDEFVAETGARWELLAACLMGREVAVRITGRRGL